ncbi:hypothetical protein, partial [Desulfosarcina cetonica]|uniref:hypothetical protein n=1 Tax=Desulfosarcina cetonica TaxID=90730 RepID=UPI00155D98AE
DLAPFTALAEAAAGGTGVTVTLLAAMDRDPTDVIRAMAPLGIPGVEKKKAAQPIRHTLILLVQN